MKQFCENRFVVNFIHMVYGTPKYVKFMTQVVEWIEIVTNWGFDYLIMDIQNHMPPYLTPHLILTQYLIISTVI